MNIKLIDFKREYEAIGAETLAIIDAKVQHGEFIMRSDIDAFEREFASYCGTTHCVGVASGTAALHLSLVALHIGRGDEVITTDLSFNATAEAISYTGATPVFVDITPTNGLLDTSKVEAAITPRTKAILPVHLYGMAVPMKELVALCNARNIKLLEDCAQAHGTTYYGQHVGSFGIAGCFSFMPAKNLGAYGDAGAIVTNDAILATTLRELRDHGRKEKYIHHRLGYAERMDNIQAAVLSIKLKRLDEWNNRRRKIAKQYLQGVRTDSLQHLPVPSEVHCTYYGFHVLSEQREMLRNNLANAGIETNCYYPLPLHRQPLFSALPYTTNDFPYANEFTNKVFALPIHPFLTETEIEYIIEKLLQYAK